MIAPTARIPKRESPMYDGVPWEWVRIKCGECSASIHVQRHEFDAARNIDGWSIECDPETGRIIAICPSCRDRETTDAPGEEGV